MEITNVEIGTISFQEYPTRKSNQKGVSCLSYTHVKSKWMDLPATSLSQRSFYIKLKQSRQGFFNIQNLFKVISKHSDKSNQILRL